jgi:organic radical activating enzyme
MQFERIPRVYMTLACNYSCEYCVNQLPPRKMLTGEQWIEIIDALPGDEVIFTGGEPTIYKDFVKVVNGIHKNKVWVYTNMSWDVSMLDRLERPLIVFASFHPGQKQTDTADVVASRAAELVRRGHTLRDIHVVVANENADSYVSTFEAHGVKLRVENDQWDLLNNIIPDTDVTCRIDRMLIGPDGKRYICVRKLEFADATGYVDHLEDAVVQPCAIHGECRPCDVRVYRVTPLTSLPRAAEG